MKHKLISKKSSGFTLIELLVVIGIISILAEVVLVSVNLARDKTKEKAIFSNLKNMVTTAEIYFSQNNSYPNEANCYTVYGNTIAALNKLNTYSRCFTAFTSLDWGFSTRLIGDVTKNYSVSSSGVVFQDISTKSLVTMNWSSANTYCSNLGASLPSYDQFYSLRDAYQNETIRPNFGNVIYWTSTTVPTNSNQAYAINFEGNIMIIAKNNSLQVVCVKPI